VLKTVDKAKRQTGEVGGELGGAVSRMGVVVRGTLDAGV